MIEAAKKIAKATDGSEVKIGEVGAANNQGAAANQESVNGIADGMKEIVDAGGKDALKAAAAAGGGGNNAGAGKLFGGANGNAGASDDDIGKAAAAVNAVSGEQILKAIVDAAAGGGNKVAGAAAGAADNPIAAAIGTDADGADFGAGGADDNKEAGKLFGGANGNGGASDNDIGKAAAAVNAVSGEQILKAIVDAAAGGGKDGAAAGDANNPIAAAIGTNAQGGDFGAGMQNSSDKIAAAIVLRGMAKNGKFSLAAQNNADQKAKVKSVVR